MKFNYQGRDQEGKLQKGVIEALNLAEAESKLREKGLFILEIKRKIFLALPTRKKIKTDDLIFFLRQLAFLLKSGINLSSALEIIESSLKDPIVKNSIRRIREETSSGASLSNSLLQIDTGFPRLIVEIIRVGEATGNLSEVMSRLADFLSREEDLKTKIKQVMSYPLVTLLLVGTAVIFLLVTIVPVFTRIYRSAGVALPLPTKMLVSLSSLISDYWMYLIPVLIIAYFLLKRVLNTTAGKLLWDRLLFVFPGPLGNIYRSSLYLRISSTLEILLRSGLQLTEALFYLARASGNKVTEKALLKSLELVTQGRSISHSFNAVEIFPQLFVRMVGVGEEGGNLEEMLTRMTEYFDKDLEVNIKRFTTILEPALTLILGAIVAFVALSIYLPIFDMVRLVR